MSDQPSSLDPDRGAVFGKPKRRIASDNMILIGVAVLGLMVAEWGTWSWTERMSVLQHRGVRTTATVLDSGALQGRGRRFYIDYRYIVPPDVPWRRRERAEEDDAGRVHPGDRVPIAYDPQNPSVAHLTWHGEVDGGNHTLVFVLLSFVYLMMAGFVVSFALTDERL